MSHSVTTALTRGRKLYLSYEYIALDVLTVEAKYNCLNASFTYAPVAIFSSFEESVEDHEAGEGDWHGISAAAKSTEAFESRGTKATKREYELALHAFQGLAVEVCGKQNVCSAIQTLCMRCCTLVWGLVASKIYLSRLCSPRGYLLPPLPDFLMHLSRFSSWFSHEWHLFWGGQVGSVTGPNRRLPGSAGV